MTDHLDARSPFGVWLGPQTIFYSLMKEDGRVTYLDLVDSMQQLGETWGVLPHTMLEYLSPERMFAHTQSTSLQPEETDEFGNNSFGRSLTYSEFANALRSEGRLDQVRSAVTKHRVRVAAILIFVCLVLFCVVHGGEVYIGCGTKCSLAVDDGRRTPRSLVPPPWRASGFSRYTAVLDNSQT